MNERERVQFFLNVGYEFARFDSYDYSILSRCPVDQARGSHKDRLNECFIMFDTETSKSSPDSYTVRSDGKKDYAENENYIVAWSLAINIYGWNIVCLYGSRPSELVDTIIKVNESLPGTKTIFYCHNLSYDWPFCKRFLIRELGAPIEQLNTKPHYPIDLTFIDGIHLRDSLILSQRSIERWAKDFNVSHQKAVGSWDYDRIRHQGDELTDEEMLYIQNDVLAGVECLSALRKQLGKTYAGMPFTNTGIVRAEARTRGKAHGAHAEAYKCYTDLSVYDIEEELYHGGYTHANRHYIGYVNEGKIRCYDFASSYPYVMLAEKYPVEQFAPMGYDLTPQEVLMSDEALIFRFRAVGVRLRDPQDPFPVLQVSKARKVVNGIFDNGRILETDYIDILCNEIDFQSIYGKYTWDHCWIQEVYFAYKDYLPRWLTDLVYELFERKTLLKGGDPVSYAISKGMLNAVYGMSVQKLLREEIKEDPETGEYTITVERTEEKFQKVIKRQSTFLNYATGIWVTSYAMRNILTIASHCVPHPADNALYIDTDSCYALEFNERFIEIYNESCRKKLTERGYPGIEHNGRIYYPGVCEEDGEYTKFVTVGAKRYCCERPDGSLKLTISGVPKKKGAECLEGNIENFHRGFVFRGEQTGKLTHFYQYAEIHQNEHGDEIGDSINLVPCDYLLDESVLEFLNNFDKEEVSIQIYDEKEIL